MRLYLSSYKWGNQAEKMFAMVDAPKHVGIVTNSADLLPEDGIVSRLEDDIKYLVNLGFTAERLDLRDYFDDKTGLEERLNTFGLIWARGANVFVLRRAMAQSGFDEIIKRKLANDEIVYGGYSAGACVMGSSLHGLELCDDPNNVPAGYDKEIIWNGLGIVDGTIVPHYQSNHPESEMLEKSVEYLQKNNLPFRTLRDGETLIINGNNEKISI